MKKNKFHVMRAIIAIALCLYPVNLVLAVHVGISPARVNFPQVLRGGYAERGIVVSADSEKPVEVVVQARGEIADWLNFSSLKFNVSKDSFYNLKISVMPPDDIPNGNYTGFVRIMTSQLGEGGAGQAVGIVRSALDLAIDVGITDLEFMDCSVSGLRVNSVEKGEDIIFEMEVKNDGNIRLRPSVTIDIWDQDQISILKSETFSKNVVLPTVKDSIKLKMSSKDLEVGQYWADVLVLECYSSQTLTFDILEEGALRAEGVLSGIVVKNMVNVGDTVPIEINFKNTGEKEVEAYFDGKITKDGKIFQILKTEKLSVPISQLRTFNLFFTPKKEGKYIISGRVFYNGKRTFESSATTNAVLGKFRWGSLLAPLAYLLLILLIAILLYKIRKERKAYLRRIMQMRK